MCHTIASVQGVESAGNAQRTCFTMPVSLGTLLNIVVCPILSSFPSLQFMSVQTQWANPGTLVADCNSGRLRGGLRTYLSKFRCLSNATSCATVKRLEASNVFAQASRSKADHEREDSMAKAGITEQLDRLSSTCRYVHLSSAGHFPTKVGLSIIFQRSSENTDV